jgi:Metallo-beta-lactamase superfamily
VQYDPVARSGEHPCDGDLDHIPAPGIGFVPVNAFVLHAAEPVVVDTGMPDRDFMNILGSVVDLQDVRWIWLTHPDRDHTGALFDLLEAAPRARLVATFLSMGAMSMERAIPMDRLYLLNPGQSIDVGDRILTAFRPPLFDNPGTIGLFDDSSRACFTSDCFGAPLTSPELAFPATWATFRWMSSGHVSCSGLRWTAPGSTPLIQPNILQPSIRCGTWTRHSSSARICLRLLGAPRTSFPCSRQHRRPIHSSGPIRKHSSKCSPNSNRPPLRPP